MRFSQAVSLSIIASLSVIFSCGDDDDHTDDVHHAGGNQECLDLGEYCHEAGELDAEAQECHEFMHAGADGCLDRLDECQMICDSVLEAAGGRSAGGGSAAAGAGGH